ncbi:MAG: CotH kinase family protein [Eubacterium sp.]|nr:CotH kinase family protein [Eubacterium sp.]
MMKMNSSAVRSISALAVAAAVCMTFVCFGLFCSAAAVSYAETAAPDNGIPVVTVTIDEQADGYATIEEMNNDDYHKAECYGTVKIDVPEGFHYSDFPDAVCESFAESAMEIRGRGNTTWNNDKKPYKIKLKKKASMLGFGENSHWVLIANAYDRTLIKDRMTAWLGDAYGMEFTPRGVPVDFVMRNTDGTYDRYLGSYYLSENVRIDKNRVDIHKLKKEDTDPDKITGGYLIQGGLQTDYRSPNVFETKMGTVLSFKGPDFDPAEGGYENDFQKNYIKKYIQDVEDALYSGDFDGEDVTSYRDLMDVTSAAKYWLIDQISRNGDGYGTGSTYIYKKEDTVVDGETVPGKLYWGPLWDFDFAWEYSDEGTWEGFKNNGHLWLYPMLYDSTPGGFTQEVRKQWPALRKVLGELTAEGGVIDRYYDETAKSQAEDNKINPHDDDYDGQPDEYVYKEEIEALKDWINKRTAWLDRHIRRTHELENMISAVTLEDDGREIDRKFVETGSYLGEIGEGPDKEGYTFIGWTDEDGEPLNYEDTIKGDTTLTANYLPDSEATHATGLYFFTDVKRICIDDIYSVVYPQYTVVPKDAQDRKVYWSTSDKTIAEPAENGEVKVYKTGTVTITGRLKSGLEKSYALVISEDKFSFPTSISFRRSEITMKKGQYDQAALVLEPEVSKLNYAEFESGNEKVVTVDENGVLHAVGTGTAKVTAEMTLIDNETGDTSTVKISCRVYVTGANTMKAQGRTVTISRSQVKTRSKSIARSRAIKIKKAQGKVTYALKSVTKAKNRKYIKLAAKKYRKYFKIAGKSGKITVKKGTPSGTYKLKIQVRAAGDKAYRPKTQTVTVTIKIR